MWKRMVIMLAVLLAFVATIGFVKYRQIAGAMAGQANFQPPPEAVTTVLAKTERWQGTIEAIGTVAAVKGVVISADLPGVVQTINFESGDRVEEGALLLQLDSRQEQAQLAAATAKLELSKLNLARVEGLRKEGINSQADYDLSVAEQKQAEGVVGEIKATIARKTIRAPFGGILGIRQVNVGQYLKSGDPIVPLQALDPVYVDFDVPQQEITRVNPGSEVRVTVEGAAEINQPGRITAVDSLIDEATRNVRVQATLRNPGARLRPGMFVNAHVHTSAGNEVVALPASAVAYAPYGDSVFVVEDMQGKDGKPYKGVRQQFVKLGPARGDQVAVLSGLNPGVEVVTSGVFKLRNGASVAVNNTVQPGNNPQPKPEDN